MTEPNCRAWFRYSMIKIWVRLAKGGIRCRRNYFHLRLKPDLNRRFCGEIEFGPGWTKLDRFSWMGQVRVWLHIIIIIISSSPPASSLLSTTSHTKASCHRLLVYIASIVTLLVAHHYLFYNTSLIVQPPVFATWNTRTGLLPSHNLLCTCYHLPFVVGHLCHDIVACSFVSDNGDLFPPHHLGEATTLVFLLKL